jgi:hypothetical protein
VVAVPTVAHRPRYGNRVDRPWHLWYSKAPARTAGINRETVQMEIQETIARATINTVTKACMLATGWGVHGVTHCHSSGDVDVTPELFDIATIEVHAVRQALRMCL